MANALGADIERHHPRASFSILLLPQLGDEPIAGLPHGTLIDPAGLGVASERLTIARLTLSGEELRMALAPLLVAYLAGSGESVVFISPDTVVLRPIAAVPQDAIGLLPRMRDLPSDDRSPSPEEVAALGPYDGGFLSLSTHAFASFEEVGAELWHHGAPMATSIEYFWATLPSRIPCTALSEDGLGVAYWNIHERVDLLEGLALPRVSTMRLPGFSPSVPYLLSASQGPRPRVLVSDHPDLESLLLARAQRLNTLGWRGVDDERVGDLAIDASVRGAVALAAHGRDYIERAGCIRAIESKNLGDWLGECPDGPFHNDISRYLLGMWATDDALQLWFPNPRDDQAEAFLAWVAQHGPERGVPGRFMPALDRPQFATDGTEIKEPMQPGVNLVGFLRAGFGIGEATRHFARALDEGGVPHAAISVSHQDIEDRVDAPIRDVAPIYDINLVCVNVDWLDMVRRRLGPEFMRSRYTIGTWWWESNMLPERLAQRISEFDELWVGSNFIAESLSPYASIPIRVFPLPIPVPPDEPDPVRSDLGLPGGYLFMFSFDFNSTVQRKNPEAVIDAFRRAFKPGEGASLVLKTINGDKHLNELERLRAKAREHADITIVDRFLSGPERDAWARACDCYVSLHRCEGFGLTMAEAMALGKPVIATGYSANLDFMSQDTAKLVDWEPWMLERQSGPYPAGTQWAEPDIEQAARHMRSVFEDPEAGRELGARARNHIRSTRAPTALASFVKQRLREIRVDGADRDSDGSSNPLPAVLEDAVAYNAARIAPPSGVKNRLLLRLVRPYSAATDALIERLIASDQWLFRSRRPLEQRIDFLESAVLRLADAVSLERERAAAARDEARADGEALRDLLYPEVYMSDRDAYALNGPGDVDHLGYDTTRHGDSAGAPSYAAFEDTFRGPAERVKPLLAPYVPLLVGQAPVLDIGCGRGEMLQLLAEAGVEARGVDLDAEMVSRCRAAGLDAVHSDAIVFLRDEVEPASLGGVFSAQVVEHIPWPNLANLLAASRVALRDGGVFIAETVNPHCLQSLKAFWLDPTHQHPIFPEAMLVFCRQAGFSRASIRFSDTAPDAQTRLRRSSSFAVIAYR